MANDAQRALFARRVQALAVQAAELSTLAQDFRFFRYAEQLFDVELELARLNRKVLELTPQDPSVPPPDEPPGWIHEDIPF